VASVSCGRTFRQRVKNGEVPPTNLIDESSGIWRRPERSGAPFFCCANVNQTCYHVSIFPRARLMAFSLFSLLFNFLGGAFLVLLRAIKIKSRFVGILCLYVPYFLGGGCLLLPSLFYVLPRPSFACAHDVCGRLCKCQVMAVIPSILQYLWYIVHHQSKLLHYVLLLLMRHNISMEKLFLCLSIYFPMGHLESEELVQMFCL
jgi:hypothetical protein